MPNHVHLFIYPTRDEYKIATILQSIKGKTSKRYRDALLGENAERYEQLCLKVAWQESISFLASMWWLWQNLWKWSSAHARHTNEGLLPDYYHFSLGNIYISIIKNNNKELCHFGRSEKSDEPGLS